MGLVPVMLVFLSSFRFGVEGQSYSSFLASTAEPARAPLTGVIGQSRFRADVSIWGFGGDRASGKRNLPRPIGTIKAH